MPISLETLALARKYTDEHGSSGSVTSVNGQTGAVVLDAEVVQYDSSAASHTSGSVGDAITGLNSALSDKQDKLNIVAKTASDTAVTLEENIFLIFPEMTELTITCPTTGGCYAFRFTSGETATVFSMPGITMPDGFSVEASKVYEVNILNGYGVVMSWAVV